MAEFMFPFLSVAGDRAYSDTDFAMFYNNIFTNGVIATVRDQLRVKETVVPGMRVEILTGAILIQGRQYLLTEPKQVNITPGSSTSDRTDLIVVQLDMLERAIKIVYKEGTTAVVRNENYWEMALARINVPRNATAIYNSMITDMRGNNDFCGYSKLQGNLNVEGLEQQYKSLLEQTFNAFEGSATTNQLSLEQLLTDQQALFQTWLFGLQDQLDTNQAANLQAQIDTMTANQSVVTITHNLGYYPRVDVLYWEYGLGTIGLEGQPSDVSWDGTPPESINAKAVHVSRKQVQIHVPIDYAMTAPVVKVVNKNEIFLQEGIKSMQIMIGGN